jgi:hypothetical protein
MQAKNTCKTQPPPGLDINEYLARLNTILNQLNTSSEKENAINRLDLMIGSIRSIIQKHKDPGSA